ncbi:hypothetical protein EDM22_04195 [Agromyces tardus]|uniref:MarR family transcriptional regulator n=1 Tax=Agromyces tardus TaxID=2583849 RepID=A0A3M8ALB8_9MICO|nr:hypothetical protein [Agromyces tardus]RNB51245.1 hypothetical protein EDM22_04195 [Agromyces tardus]
MTTPGTNDHDHLGDVPDAADTPEISDTKDTTMTNDTDHDTSTDGPGDAGTIPTSPRPLGYWLRVIDRRLDDEMRALFEAEGLTRRDWRRLNLIGGAVADARLAERLASRPEKVEPLVERGWVEGEPGAWRLTESGVAARDALVERVSALRARVAGAVGPEEFATTLASLEAIARTLGWSEDERMPHGPRRGIRRPHGRRPRHHGEHPHHHGGEHPHDHGHERHHGGEHPCRGHEFHHGRERRRGEHPRPTV